MSKIEFEPIKDSLEPVDCINQLIRHLELIKHDIEDIDRDKCISIPSIQMRYNGVKVLNTLLVNYLKQHNIS